MKKTMNIMVALLVWAAAALSVQAADYTTYLTTERGFTEVTSMDGIIADANYYYLIVPAETHELIVGIGRYELKPGWASEESKALRYKSADTDPILDLTNFFTIEKSGQYIGLRNVVYSADMFQTHENAGYMYVNTYTDKNFDEWSYLIPTYQDDYWLFENGKYPMSSNADEKGYMGSWTAGRFAVDEPIALNRRNTVGDEAGHYRLFRIAKDNLMEMFTAAKREVLLTATSGNPIDATWLITNPSFETGDETGWVLQYKDAGNNEFTARDYGMTNKEGGYLMNVYQWWNDHSVSQVVDNLPSGEYELSAVLCTWEDRTATLTGQTSVSSATATINGINDATGIPASVNVVVGYDQQLTIIANSTTDWWSSGHTGDGKQDEHGHLYVQLFYKVDDVQLTCKGLYLNGVAKPLPNDETTVLDANQWYYYDVDYSMEHWLIGNITDMVYSTDGLKLLSDITTTTVAREMTLPKGRVYFKTTRSDATLKIVAKREVIESTNSFTACALNVDGLPDLFGLNPDGPGSDGTKKIGSYLNNKAYDIIAFSEDFNYHSDLTNNISGYTWGTHRGKVLSLSNNTDGLEFACKKSSVTWENETYVKYNSTASTDGNQYIKKGYRHYDVTFDGQLIDVYITHMDAGDNNDAITSRGKQWKQLTEAINAVDNGRDAPRPKIVMGDTNCRWTRDGVKANFLDSLSSNFTASDVWVEFCRNGIYPTIDMADLTDKSDPLNYSNYEIVDKIIYINPKAANTAQLVPQSFKIEQDYTYEDGTTPLGDHPPVVVEFKVVHSGAAVPLTLDLPNNADNTKAIADMSGATATVTLSGRTLYKDDYWNTLCLPFDMTAAQVTNLLDNNSGTLMELDNAGTYEHPTGVDGTTLYLNFKNASTITAGTPYLIKWSAGSNIENPTFTDVTISDNAVAGNVTFNDGQFIGTYSPVPLTNDGTNLYIGSDNKLKWPQSDTYTLKAFRAYFDVPSPSPARQFVLNFGDEETTAIVDLNPQSSTLKPSLYDLMGRQAKGQKTKPGIYVMNGQKVIVK